MSLEAYLRVFFQSCAQVYGCVVVIQEDLIVAELYAGLYDHCDDVVHAILDAFFLEDAAVGGYGVTECVGLVTARVSSAS